MQFLPEMKLVLLAIVVAAGVGAAQARSPFLYGHAAYTYGPLHCSSDPCEAVPSCNKAQWAQDIAAYNQASGSKASMINIVYAYGGDMEMWSGKGAPRGCWAPASTDSRECNTSAFYDPVNAAAAAVYRATPGVDGVVALLDGRMDGWQQIQTFDALDACEFGDFYPNLANLTDQGLRDLARQTARLYCADGNIAGVQIDLEPYRDPYKQALGAYVGYVATELVDADGANGCRTAAWPNGRSVSYFTFAHDHEASFTETLGPNGYYVFSGYDLYPKDDAFSYNTVAEFGQKLRREIASMRGVLGSTGRFTLALPLAASCHEYEQYVPMRGAGCGPACAARSNSAQMHEYVQEAFNVLLDPATTNATGGLFCLNATAESQFLGLSLWTWTYGTTYPPMKWFDNAFLPATPSAATLQVLRDNLPRLSDGTTCLSGPAPGPTCTADADRPDGCACEHKWQCASQYCTGTCQEPSS